MTFAEACRKWEKGASSWWEEQEMIRDFGLDYGFDSFCSDCLHSILYLQECPVCFYSPMENTGTPPYSHCKFCLDIDLID